MIINRINHKTGQNRKNEAYENMFLPVKNVIAANINVMQERMDKIDINKGCQAKSYLDVSQKYVDVHQPNPTVKAMLISPKKKFFLTVIFFILILAKQHNTIAAKIIAPDTHKNTYDSTNAIAKNDAKIFSGAIAKKQTAKITHKIPNCNMTKNYLLQKSYFGKLTHISILGCFLLLNSLYDIDC